MSQNQNNTPTMFIQTDPILHNVGFQTLSAIKLGFSQLNTTLINGFNSVINTLNTGFQTLIQSVLMPNAMLTTLGPSGGAGYNYPISTKAENTIKMINYFFTALSGAYGLKGGSMQFPSNTKGPSTGIISKAPFETHTLPWIQNIKSKFGDMTQYLGVRFNQVYQGANWASKGLMGIGYAGYQIVKSGVQKTFSQVAQLGPQMLTMAIITKPLTSFLEGLLSPFEIFSDTFGAFGEILSSKAIQPLLLDINNILLQAIPYIDMFATAIGNLYSWFKGGTLGTEVNKWWQNIDWPTINFSAGGSLTANIGGTLIKSITGIDYATTGNTFALKITQFILNPLGTIDFYTIGFNFKTNISNALSLTDGNFWNTFSYNLNWKYRLMQILMPDTQWWLDLRNWWTSMFTNLYQVVIDLILASVGIYKHDYDKNPTTWW